MTKRMSESGSAEKTGKGDSNMFEDFNVLRGKVNTWARSREKKFLEDFCKEAGLKEPIGYSYTYGQGFTIYTTRPRCSNRKTGCCHQEIFTAVE